ncbi:MAG: ATP-grasp domain-containing protein [Bacillota bacterium]|nr:ATP-grasp domain-containing protein [Bacillota bacterium]
MKVAIVYNYQSRAVINLFGTPSKEVYGIQTIKLIQSALESGGHQVIAFEGDKNIINILEKFMPPDSLNNNPGIVFNLSYGIQGKARYTHIPAILEMLGIPYVGSSPYAHAIALDKVLTKILLLQKGLPTPRFMVIDEPELTPIEELNFPIILKPKDEARSMGLTIVYNIEQFRSGVSEIIEKFETQVLAEEFIDGREICIGLLGNKPAITLPPVELLFCEGLNIYTYEDKTKQSKRKIEKICPAKLQPEQLTLLQKLAVKAFNALECYDCARIDFRYDREDQPYILEVNSMASLEPDSSFILAAKEAGLSYEQLLNKLIDIAAERYSFAL